MKCVLTKCYNCSKRLTHPSLKWFYRHTCATLLPGSETASEATAGLRRSGEGLTPHEGSPACGRRRHARSCSGRGALRLRGLTGQHSRWGPCPVPSEGSQALLTPQPRAPGPPPPTAGGGRGAASTHMMLALCTAVTLLRWLLRAYAKANSAMRRLASSVMSLMLCTTPSTICGEQSCLTRLPPATHHHHLGARVAHVRCRWG